MLSISKSSINGLASSFSQRAGSCAGSSASSSTMRPTRTCSTPSKPSAGKARSTALPCGSRIPCFGRIRTRAFGTTASSALEGALRDPLIGLDVLGPRLLDHVGRQLGRRWLVIPAGGIGPVANELLVKGRLRLARLIAVGRPEARGVGGKYLVGKDDLGAGVATELELGIGEDDAALSRVLGTALVDLDRDP